MTILQALDRYYDRITDIAPPGWSSVEFGWCVVIDTGGKPVDVLDLYDRTGKRGARSRHVVPAEVKRTSAPKANILWDKTSYSLGRSAIDDPKIKRQHALFAEQNLAFLAEADDEGLQAFRCFLEGWSPECYDALPHAAEMLDGNVMFRLAGDSGYLHQRAAARALVDARATNSQGHKVALCLVTGQTAPVARLHPTIRGVEGAQSSGASLVAFEQHCSRSYGKEQGDNAPTSEAAAFRYGAALNRLLARGSRNRVSRPIGDATVVFWADASDAEAAEDAEGLFGGWLDPPPTDADEARRLSDALEKVAKGRPDAAVAPALAEGTRFHVLGLSPNAARLSVRYWLTGSFREFAERLAMHHADLALEPRPVGWGAAPAVNRLLVKTAALQEKFDNIPPMLAGEVMRAVLSGGRYPRAWLAAAVTRLRAGDDPLTGWHAAAIRAVLARDHRLGLEKEDVPVSLSREADNQAYQLGRLFAVLETAQRMALGKINATIRDRYFGAASATPAGVFPLLLRGAQNHLGRLRKDGKGGWIEREIEEILARLSLDLPRALPLTEQGRFAVGYYHQRREQFVGRPDTAAELDAAEQSEEGNEQ